MRLKRTNGSDEMNEAIKVSIWRGHGKGHYVAYEVPRLGSQTVLDIVTYVQRYIDPTLSYRFACRVGVCGSCAMTVNGRPRWTCRTHVEKVTDSGRLELGPPANLPVIKDLATDMTRFFEKWQQAKGTFVPSKTRNDAIEEIDPDTWSDWLNLRSQIEISKVITHAALKRENSRGAHFRSDFPDLGDLATSRFTLIRKQDHRIDVADAAVEFTIVKPGESLLKEQEAAERAT